MHALVLAHVSTHCCVSASLAIGYMQTLVSAVSSANSSAYCRLLQQQCNSLQTQNLSMFCVASHVHCNLSRTASSAVKSIRQDSSQKHSLGQQSKAFTRTAAGPSTSTYVAEDIFQLATSAQLWRVCLLSSMCNSIWHKHCKPQVWQ